MDQQDMQDAKQDVGRPSSVALETGADEDIRPHMSCRRRGVYVRLWGANAIHINRSGA